MCLCACLAVTADAADTIGSRHGSIPVKPDAPAYEAGVTMTYQDSDDNNLESEGFASFDFVANIPARNGILTMYMEANTSPQADGVSSVLGEVNADLGSALNDKDDGRLQLSVLHYMIYLGNDALVFGLLDPTGPLDNSDVANDETSQFLGGTFVNNPTIAFPDYTLGAVYFLKPEQSNTDFTFLLSSSNGLGDNESRDYDDLFNIGNDEKGIFAAGEMKYHLDNHQIRAGAWIQTAENEQLDGTGTDDNYGVYLSSDHSYEIGNFNIRIGFANEDVSEAESFYSIAYETEIQGSTVGVAFSQTNVSDKADSALDDTRQFEVYGRFDINEQFHITPSFQWLENSNFDASNTVHDDEIAVYGLRVNYLF
jgi:hypothetical protein